MSRRIDLANGRWSHIYRFIAYHLFSSVGFTSAIWILYLQHRGYSLTQIGIGEAVFHLAPIWLPDFVPLTQNTVLFVASLMISFGTLFVSGVPAALFERLSGRQETDRAVMLVWLAGALALALPGLAGAI